MDELGYLVIVILGLVTVMSVMIAAGTRRTHDDDLAWQRQHDFSVMLRLADRADQLAADGHHRPGTAAINEYQHQCQRAEQNR